MDWTVADPGQTGTVVNVDMWWETSDGARLHLWQTNSPTIDASGKDPAAPTLGSAVSIGDAVWRLVEFHSGPEPWMQLGRRFEDGITVSIDAPASFGLAWLRQVVASIR